MEPHGPLPLPIAALLAAAGAGGGGIGIGTWALLAAQAAKHPTVAAGATMSKDFITAGAQHIYANEAARSHIPGVLIGMAITVVLCAALVAACICGGGIAVAWTWNGTASFAGIPQPQPQQYRTHAQAYEGAQTPLVPAVHVPTTRQLDALALEVVSGGRQAHRQIAQVFQVDPALVEDWTASWAQAAHQRYWTGNGLTWKRKKRRGSDSEGQ